ncbi:MAG: putative transcriptional regulator [Thermoleophilaceae bacterium]|jgi:putative transcriptional regulator|nr:putative transcriptional regulator [Thermoleophilaceae bacterium]
MSSLKGQLLVASPALLDPNFERTVVLIAQHDESGAMGVVLNRAGDLPVADAAPMLADIVEPGAIVHSGGPVQPTGVVVVAQFLDPASAAVPVFGDVGFVGGEPDLETLAGDIVRARVFAGLAGWGPGQLEAELEREDWILEPALEDDVFAEDPGSLWAEVLERKGGSFALLARMPPDPSLN